MTVIINRNTNDIRDVFFINTQSDLIAYSEFEGYSIANQDEINNYQLTQQARQDKIDNLTNNFLSIWNTFTPYYQAIFAPLKQQVLLEIQNLDYTSLRNLANDSSIPDYFQSYQEQLITLLPSS